jgi:hypothetical protein
MLVTMRAAAPRSGSAAACPFGALGALGALVALGADGVVAGDVPGVVARDSGALAGAAGAGGVGAAAGLDTTA